MLDKISRRDLLARSLYEISVHALYKSSLDKIKQDLSGDLLARSLDKISVGVLYKSPFGKTCVRDLVARSLQKDLYAMSLYKASIRGILARSPYKISKRALLATSLKRAVSEELLAVEIYRKSVRAQNLGPHFLQACAVDVHFNISQEALYTQIYRKNAAAQNLIPHWARRSNPQDTISSGEKRSALSAPVDTSLGECFDIYIYIYVYIYIHTRAHTHTHPILKNKLRFLSCLPRLRLPLSPSPLALRTLSATTASCASRGVSTLELWRAGTGRRRSRPKMPWMMRTSTWNPKMTLILLMRWRIIRNKGCQWDIWSSNRAIVDFWMWTSGLGCWWWTECFMGRCVAEKRWRLASQFQWWALLADTKWCTWGWITRSGGSVVTKT